MSHPTILNSSKNNYKKIYHEYQIYQIHIFDAMIPMLFPHASSVFPHGSPNLSLTTLQYCHFDHAKRPQQHEPSVLPSHSPPTSPGRHWGSRHLRIVSAGSWINKDQVAKLQRKKTSSADPVTVQCYSIKISMQTSWWWCQLRPQSLAPPVFF